MLSVDLTFKIELDNGFVHGDHAKLPVRLHDTSQLMGFALTDQVTDRMVGMHDLKRCHTVFTVRGRDQLLRDYGFQGIGQLYSDLLLLMGREYIDDTVYGTGGTDGMLCRQYQMSGLRCRDCYADGLEVTHLSYENDIGVFTKGCS